MIAIVPIRSGSKGIKNKNIKNLNGKPLVWWILDSLVKSKIDKIIVASDEPYIQKIDSFKFNKVEIYLRDNINSKDVSSSEDVLIEVINKFKIKDDILFAQATSPLTSYHDINRGIELYKSKEYDSILSVVRLKRFIWSEDGEPINYNYKKRPRRQDFNGIIIENGAIYINSSENIVKANNRLSGKIGFLEMSENNFHEIDTKNDWRIINTLISSR